MKDLIKNYMNFLDNAKTERRCVIEGIKLAEKAGYKDIFKTKTLKAGDKVYLNKMGKSLILFNIGSDPIENGMKILGAHIDSPRLDVKSNPVYENDNIVYLNTHYYGGIKNYQWVAMPLAINGFVFLKNGNKIDINIGDKDNDPVFCISDILPHLAQDQMKKTASEIIEAEKLDIILGCEHVTDKNKKTNKDKILSILKDNYGFEEKDFESAELEIVPAGKSRFLGLDKSLILAYGQDDRVCAFTSLAAFLETEATKQTNCCVLVDKEEIGSVGATGMDSHLFDNAVAEVVARLTSKNFEITLRRALSNSIMLSSDVTTCYDPLNSELYDKDNVPHLSSGVGFFKFTGSRGKSASNDANPEFISVLRNALDKEKVTYQLRETSKVDKGGFGTIAKYSAAYGMQVIDCGTPVLSMHAPWEITSVFDVEQTYLCYKAFLKNC